MRAYTVRIDESFLPVRNDSKPVLSLARVFHLRARAPAWPQSRTRAPGCALLPMSLRSNRPTVGQLVRARMPGQRLGGLIAGDAEICKTNCRAPRQLRLLAAVPFSTVIFTAKITANAPGQPRAPSILYYKIDPYTRRVSDSRAIRACTTPTCARSCRHSWGETVPPWKHTPTCVYARGVHRADVC
jgi:hypothetical protein